MSEKVEPKKEQEIKLGSGQKIIMRKPKVKDNRAVAHIENDSEREIALFSNLTGLSIEEIDELYMSDYAKLQEVYMALAIGE